MPDCKKILMGVKGAVAWLSPYLRKLERILPYVLAAVYAIGLAMMLSHHEMWRDETQAWLLARDSASPAALLHNMRYEGHPGLWHLLLWGPAQFTSDPLAMQIVHGIIAIGAVFMVLRFAPFRWPTRILLSSGYFFAYEWAVVSRNYAISVLLFFLFAALHRKRWRWFPLQALVAFALCHTNIHSLILVLVLLPMLAIEYAVAYAGSRRDARSRLASACLGVVIIVLGIVTGIRQIAPPADTGFATKWHFQWQMGRAQTTARRMVDAYLPVPKAQTRFWNSNRFAGELPKAKYLAAAIAIAAAISLLFLCQPWPILPYLGGTIALLTFFYVKYPGSIRHHGFLFLWPIVLLWMCADYQPWSLPWRRANWPFRMFHRFRELPLMVLLLFHVNGTMVAARADWNAPFSMSKATAEWIRANVPGWDQMLLAGGDAPQTSAVAAHLRAPQIFYTERNDYGSYVIWDNKRKSQTAKAKHNLEALMRQEDKDILLVTSGPANAKRLPAGTTLLKVITGDATTESRYHVYQCACPATNLRTSID
jgi:hypothetical protein